MRLWVVSFALSAGMCALGLALSAGVWWIWHHFFGGQDLAMWIIDTLVIYVLYRDTLDYHRTGKEIEIGDAETHRR